MDVLPDLNRPETWTLVGMLLLAVTSFMRGAVMPGTTHDKIVGHLKEEHQKHVERLEQDCQLWRSIALRSLQLSEKSVDVIEKVRR